MIGEMHAEGIKVRAHSQLCHVDVGRRRGWVAGKKMCLMFTGKDGCGVQCGGHSACIFPLLSAREAGVPGAHSFNKYLLRDFFVLVSMPGALISQFLPIAGRVLAADGIQIRWFK